MRRLKFNRFWLHLISGSTFTSSKLENVENFLESWRNFLSQMLLLLAHFLLTSIHVRWWSLKSFNYLLNARLHHSWRQLQKLSQVQSHSRLSENFTILDIHSCIFFGFEKLPRSRSSCNFPSPSIKFRSFRVSGECKNRLRFMTGTKL